VVGAMAGLVGGGLHWTDLVDLLMWGFLFLLELIGAIIKPFALMIRLFANMVAGHIVLASILFLIFATKSVMMGYTVGAISVAGCVAISCLELFVAFLQAYIFVFLTTLFLSMSVAPEH
jgi:F-type H+-transporting ATPase subunit a